MGRREGGVGLGVGGTYAACDTNQDYWDVTAYHSPGKSPCFLIGPCRDALGIDPRLDSGKITHVADLKSLTGSGTS